MRAGAPWNVLAAQDFVGAGYSNSSRHLSAGHDFDALSTSAGAAIITQDLAETLSERNRPSARSHRGRPIARSGAEVVASSATPTSAAVARRYIRATCFSQSRAARTSVKQHSWFGTLHPGDCHARRCESAS